jgi:hypothetical protein
MARSRKRVESPKAVAGTTNRAIDVGSNTPIIFVGTGAINDAQVTSDADNFGMPAGTVPSPHSFPPHGQDQYLNLSDGSFTAFTGPTSDAPTGVTHTAPVVQHTAGGATISVPGIPDWVDADWPVNAVVRAHSDATRGGRMRFYRAKQAINTGDPAPGDATPQINSITVENAFAGEPYEIQSGPHGHRAVYTAKAGDTVRDVRDGVVAAINNHAFLDHLHAIIDPNNDDVFQLIGDVAGEPFVLQQPVAVTNPATGAVVFSMTESLISAAVETGWEDITPQYSVADLANVDTLHRKPVNGDVLVFNGSRNEWEAGQYKTNHMTRIEDDFVTSTIDGAHKSESEHQCYVRFPRYPHRLVRITGFIHPKVATTGGALAFPRIIMKAGDPEDWIDWSPANEWPDAGIFQGLYQGAGTQNTWRAACGDSDTTGLKYVYAQDSWALGEQKWSRVDVSIEIFHSGALAISLTHEYRDHAGTGVWTSQSTIYNLADCDKLKGFGLKCDHPCFFKIFAELT